eukprot:TRINITY_DN6094_c0_g1_i3.p3 TRINITY_DN6094_c0_g1~~TRINITY_DN6094_c0_g1_i3.p3  ORF type:complete len:224 (-),score=51.20 TRINITY_DN6094_c0_g1_i3:180-827(-)
MALATRCPLNRQLSRRSLTVQAATQLPSKFSKVSPVGDRVYVKIDKEEETSVGGILIPTAAQKKPNRGTVEVVGNVKEVKTGDKVIYSKYAGTELDVQEQSYILLKEGDVVGILSGDGSVASLKPLGSRILLKIPEMEQKTGGGVLLTTDAADKPTLGEVVAVGEGELSEEGKREEVTVKPGDTVMYSKYSGAEFEEGDDKYVVLKEAELLASLS